MIGPWLSPRAKWRPNNGSPITLRQSSDIRGACCVATEGNERRERGGDVGVSETEPHMASGFLICWIAGSSLTSARATSHAIAEPREVSSRGGKDSGFLEEPAS